MKSGVIAIDTNVLVRFLVRDNDAQYRASHRLFSTEDILIPDTVVLETEWVLRYAYELEPAIIGDALRRIFGLPNVHLANGRRIAQAVDWYVNGLDFADALHLVTSQGDSASLKTFDTDFIRRARKLAAGDVARP